MLCYKSIYKNILKNNPEIKKIKFQKTKENYFDLWHGMISKFNFYDIEYFLKYDWRNRPQEVMIKQEKIQSKYKIDFTWVLSPYTLAVLEEKLKPKIKKFYGLYHKKNKEFLLISGYTNSKPKNIQEFINDYGEPINYNIKDLKIIEVEIFKK